MSYAKFVELTCDHCLTTFSSGSFTATDTRRDAHETEGWIKRGKKDYCEQCKLKPELKNVN